MSKPAPMTLPGMRLARVATACMALALAAPTASAQTIPVPTERPDREAEAGRAAESPRETIPAEEPAVAPSPVTAPDPAEILACRSALEARKVRYTLLDPLDYGEGCALPLPVKVTAIGDVAVEAPVTINCAAAAALADWLAGVVEPAVKTAFPGDRLTALRQASGYVCRNRNNAGTGRLSEHATGNAIDIAAFRFASGRTITIEPRERTGSMDEAFQKSVRFGACLHFTTVIGPLSDAHHDDHLHFDLAERRGGWRLCEFPGRPQPAE